MKLWGLVGYTSRQNNKSKISVACDAVHSVFKYNVSLKDYFCFRFFELNQEERRKWAGTGYMYEFQLKMNPKVTREILENKVLFLKHYQLLNKRKFCTLHEAITNNNLLYQMLSSSPGRLVLKGSRGQVGNQVEIIFTKDKPADQIFAYMKKKNLDLIEEYVVQHHLLNQMSPSGLNTIRLFTQLHNDEVFFLGARLRISVNSVVDNMAAGNLAASVDIETGIVNGPGIYSDITKADQYYHPVTGMEIIGFRIPYWDKIVSFVDKAAHMMPENKSVGWDVAVTEEGPELIEGNHNWCKLLWQMPVKKGLKSELERFH